jgi:hypothetical protein
MKRKKKSQNKREKLRVLIFWSLKRVGRDWVGNGRINIVILA